jgi:hypothetical protein
MIKNHKIFFDVMVFSFLSLIEFIIFIILIDPLLSQLRRLKINQDIFFFQFLNILINFNFFIISKLFNEKIEFYFIFLNIFLNLFKLYFKTIFLKQFIKQETFLIGILNLIIFFYYHYKVLFYYYSNEVNLFSFKNLVLISFPSYSYWFFVYIIIIFFSKFHNEDYF